MRRSAETVQGLEGNPAQPRTDLPEWTTCRDTAGVDYDDCPSAERTQRIELVRSSGVPRRAERACCHDRSPAAPASGQWFRYPTSTTHLTTHPLTAFSNSLHT